MRLKEKRMIKFSVTRNGVALDKTLYTWDEESKTFYTEESDLVLDFYNIHGVTFKTGDNCTFDTGHHCTFDTGYGCTFNAGHGCTFKTGDYCTFDTGYLCTFDTGYGCTFNTGHGCMFKAGYGCTLKTGSDCVIVRNDVFEIIQPEDGVTIKLNGLVGVKGYEVIEAK